MPRKLFSLLFCLLCLTPAGFSSPQPVDFSQRIREAGNLARKGEWDRSELVFLKAAESPVPDQRLEAYAGLQGLYQKLRLAKKARRAERRLRNEKKFLAKLVPKENSYYKNYTVQEGDTYAKIAAREGISLEWLRRANENKILIAGKSIRVPVVKYSLVVSKKRRTLEWCRGEEVLKIYPVSVGRKGSETPEGEFTIISKVKNPIWYRLKVQIPPDSPKNLLGPRWLGLDQKGYGIHGTRHPGSIRGAVSHGCVRLYNRDVEELFEWIPIGTKVSIH